MSHIVEFIEEVTTKQFNAEDFIFKADIISMYPNINLNNALSIAANLLGNNTNEGNTLDTTEWYKILADAFECIYFKWNKKLYKCTSGLPIGLPAAPQLAIITAQTIIEENWDENKEKIFKIYKAYIDDHFGIASEDPTKHLEEIIKHESQPKLKFETPETIMLRKLVEENKSFDTTFRVQTPEQLN